MALTSEVLSTKMLTHLNYGVVDGKDVVKSKSYSNVKSDATIETIQNIAEMICNLQVPTLEEVMRIETALILDDGL